MPERDWYDQPCYTISVAATLVRMHPQTLRNYERSGLIEPQRSLGNIRLYSPRDIDRMRRIIRLTEELGVNLAGVEVILRMSDHMREMHRRMKEMEAEFEAEIQRMEEKLRSLQGEPQAEDS